MTVGIYVLPTVRNVPPRALLFEGGLPAELPPGLDGESLSMLEVPAQLATWSADEGCWAVAGAPVDPGLSEAITAHAKSLGVEW